MCNGIEYITYWMGFILFGCFHRRKLNVDQMLKNLYDQGILKDFYFFIYTLFIGPFPVSTTLVLCVGVHLMKQL